MSVYSATNAKTHTASESHFCQIRPRLVGCIPHGPRHHIVELSNGLFMDLETSKFVESHKPTVIIVNRVDENPSENPNFIKAIVGFLVYTTGDGIIHSLDIKPVDIDGDEFDIGLRSASLRTPQTSGRSSRPKVQIYGNVHVFLEWFPFRKLWLSQPDPCGGSSLTNLTFHRVS